MAEKVLWDFLSTLEGGVNSDLAPILLEKNVAAWTINSTLRGGFARPRPPIFKQTLTFPSAEVQTAFETGFFQGASKTPYRPDFGPSQHVVQISGRLYTITETSPTWTVVDITIPGDANDATTNQVWMNQAEKWLIITDGTAKLPIFWDGVTARRSYGPSVAYVNPTEILATAPLTPPAIGDIVTLTLSVPYTGPFNVPVLFNGAFYQTNVSPTPGYSVILTNISDTPAAVIPTDSPVVVQPGTIGYAANTFGFIFPPPAFVEWEVAIDEQLSSSVSIGDTVLVSGFLCTITYISPPHDGVITLEGTAGTVSPPAGASTAIPIGTLVQLPAAIAPNVTIGNTIGTFVVPAVGGTVTVDLTMPFTGVDGTAVWIGTQQYTIANPPPPGASTTLYLVNLSDVSTTAYDTPPGHLATMDVLSVPELPAGRMGAYGLGHQTMSLTDGISFIYGDAVGGPAGTVANNYRDAVLKTTENTFLSGGGSFRIPNSGEQITAMIFTAKLDASYGQGPLIIGTPSNIFSCDVPTDRSLWIALTNPILTEVLIGKGPLAQNSTILANSDALFRSNEGLGSLIFGRRDFVTWGNTPISSEMNRTVSRDIRSLLSYGSAIVFDNRLLSTAAPQVSAQGVYHIGTLALNFDPVSSLRGKAPSIWESLWTGTNVLQYVAGTFGATERAFQFTFNQNDSKIELWEQYRSDSGEYFDNGDIRIPWVVETPCIFKPDERSKDLPIVRLINGKIHLADVVGTLNVKVLYRPDFYPCWIDWIEFPICVVVDPDNPNSQPGYKTPIGLGEPPATPCEEGNNRPMRSARFFQLRFEFTGQATFMGGEFAAVSEPSITFPAPICCVSPLEDA